MNPLHLNPLKANTLAHHAPQRTLFAAGGGGGDSLFSDENSPPIGYCMIKEFKKIPVHRDVMPLHSVKKQLTAEMISLPKVTGFERLFVERCDQFEPATISKSNMPEHLSRDVALTPHISQIIEISKQSSSMSIPAMKQFVGPTNLGLIYLAGYYSHKYDIDISVTGSFEAFAEAIKAPPLRIGQKAWGIISVLEGFQSHATAVICYQKDSSSPIHHIELDSTNDPNIHVSSTLDALKKEHQKSFSYFKVNGQRQLDLIGCRTDALCLLKDALRLLNSCDIDDMTTFLNASHTSDISPARFNLPATWAKTVQNPRALISINSDLPLISGESLKSFRQRYTLTEARRDESYRICYDLETGERIQRTYMYSLLKPQCAYLNYKGKRNFLKVVTIQHNERTDERNGELVRIIRRIEAFFPGKKVDLQTYKY